MKNVLFRVYVASFFIPSANFLNANVPGSRGAGPSPLEPHGVSSKECLIKKTILFRVYRMLLAFLYHR